MDKRFEQQMEFIVEIDKMKSVYRQTILIDESRRETDAEHSWHFAMAAIVFAEYAHSSEVNLKRVVEMALAHDLVEIYAGDTYAYDEQANEDKNERETRAAERLFALLPEDQGARFKALWEEFDKMESPDALYANAIDCLQPLISSYMTKGKMWRKNRATSRRVYERMEKIRRGAPPLYEWVKRVIEESVDKGYLDR